MYIHKEKYEKELFKICKQTQTAKMHFRTSQNVFEKHCVQNTLAYLHWVSHTYNSYLLSVRGNIVSNRFFSHKKIARVKEM